VMWWSACEFKRRLREKIKGMGRCPKPHQLFEKSWNKNFCRTFQQGF